MRSSRTSQVKTSVPEDRVHQIERRLRAAYGQPRHFNPEDPLDDLVFLVLSRMTQEIKYRRTYDELRREYSDWEAVRDAPRNDLELLLSDAGLATTKAAQIQGILTEIRRREGALDLGRLRHLPDPDVERYLTTLPGVGRKTALCVMLYALGQDVLPVDAHVWRLARRLGLAPDEPWSERGGLELESAIPKGIRASLHVTLLAHGRAICTARSPRCDECILADVCPGYRAESPQETRT